LELMKYDTNGKKGGELLIQHGAPLNAPVPRKPAGTNYDLNVEIGSDGTVKVIPPLTNTNSPAH